MESDTVISYVDLALYLWVAPDGTQTVLDKDEFANLVWTRKHANRPGRRWANYQNYLWKNEPRSLLKKPGF